MKKLNFGCGFEKMEGYDNVDDDDFDFNVFPYPIKDNTYDYIYCHAVIEHMDDVWGTLKELHRIMKPNAELELITSHHNCESAYNSLQHKTFFNETAFKEFIFRNPGIFDIKELFVEPTIAGRFMPEFIRNYVARHIGHLKGRLTCIYVKLDEVKE